MFATAFAILAGTLPVALFCSTGVLLVARLRKPAWSWPRTAAVAAGLSALVSLVAFGAVAFAFAGGMRPFDAAAALLGGSLQAALVVGLVASGTRFLDRQAGR